MAVPHWGTGAQGPGAEPGMWVWVTGRKDSPKPQLFCYESYMDGRWASLSLRGWQRLNSAIGTLLGD